jgi:hypothetical protein
MKYQEQTATGISLIVSLMEAARGEASGANLNLIQSGFTAAAGAELGDQGLAAVQARKAGLSGAMARGAAGVGRGANTGDLIREFAIAMGELPEEDRSAFEGVSHMMGPEGRRQQEETLASYRKKLAAEKEQARNLSGPARDAELARIARKERAAMTATAAAQAAGGLPTASDLALPSFMKLGQTTELGVPLVTPGGSVGAAVVANANRTVVGAPGAATGGIHAPGAIHTPGSTAGGSLGEITVHVEGYCLDCGEKIKGSDQTYATNVAQRARP